MTILRIDGPIINLAHWHGIGMQEAAEFIANLSRIQITSKKHNQFNNPAGEIEIISKNDPRFCNAKRRIDKMQKALANMASGRPHNMHRKHWRKNPGDAEYVLETFIHVISRTKPETQEDIDKDIRILLVRTGEAEDYRYKMKAPPTYNGNLGISVNITQEEVSIRLAENDAITARSNGIGSMQITMQQQLPQSVIQRINASCEAQEPAHSIIDWKAFYGEIEAQLICCSPNQYDINPDTKEPKTSVSIETGYITYDKKTNEIRMQKPGVKYWRAA